MSKEVLQIKESTKNIFLEKPTVVGVGIGYKITKGIQTDRIAVVAMVEKKKPLSALTKEERLPVSLQIVGYSARGTGEIKSVPVDVIEVGRIEALGYTGRYRPAQPGVSIGHYKITAGTFGAVVYDQFTDYPLLLSNNHVFANTNDAILNDPILQPGPIDAGSYPTDTIAKLERFVPIDFGEEAGDCILAERFVKATNYLTGVLGSQHKINVIKQNEKAVNYVDAAVARPIDMIDINKEILEIGMIDGVEDYYLGMKVRKTGRTTGYTTGEIILINATVNVNYGDGKLAKFEDQIVSGFMSQGGDSGSLLVDRDLNKAVGLLYAGSSQSTIYNPISRVLEQLKIKI